MRFLGSAHNFVRGVGVGWASQSNGPHMGRTNGPHWAHRTETGFEKYFPKKKSNFHFDKKFLVLTIFLKKYFFFSVG
jgi:hypothetical protein